MRVGKGHWIPCPYGHTEDRGIAECIEEPVCGCDCLVHYNSNDDGAPIGRFHIVWCPSHDATVAREPVAQPAPCGPHDRTESEP